MALQHLCRRSRLCLKLLQWERPLSNSLKMTSVYDLHVAHGGKMVPFGGWLMPSVYQDQSIVQSVLHTRKQLSLFDVSHMLQIEVHGKDAEAFLESITVADLQSLKIGKSTLSVITNAGGGIVDDCIITRVNSSSFYIVANAGCSEKDLDYFKKKIDEFQSGHSQVIIDILSDRGLIALQGPSLMLVMHNLTKNYDLRNLSFMDSAILDVCGVEGCRVTRCGYTGEDGIEISVPSSRAVELCEKLLKNPCVKLAGLGARDILRTEAGLCLYGNEISEETSPVEAGLGWCIGKKRRREGGFEGSEVILSQLKGGVAKKRVGLKSHGPVVRQHTKLFNCSSQHIGYATSGCPSPHLGCNIAMAYILKSHVDTEIKAEVRNKLISVKITKLPFVSSNYYHK